MKVARKKWPRLQRTIFSVYVVSLRSFYPDFPCLNLIRMTLHQWRGFWHVSNICTEYQQYDLLPNAPHCEWLFPQISRPKNRWTRWRKLFSRQKASQLVGKICNNTSVSVQRMHFFHIQPAQWETWPAAALTLPHVVRVFLSAHFSPQCSHNAIRNLEDLTKSCLPLFHLWQGAKRTNSIWLWRQWTVFRWDLLPVMLQHLRALEVHSDHDYISESSWFMRSSCTSVLPFPTRDPAIIDIIVR